MTEEKRNSIVALAKEQPDLTVHALIALMERLEKSGQLKQAEGDEILLEALNRWYRAGGQA